MDVLKDSFGRVHDYLRISLTEKCNLRCTYCMPEQGVELTPKSKLMTAEEILEITKVFIGHGVRKVRLTGGEPLIRKDFKEIVLGLKNLGLELAMTTNGVLLDRYLDVLKRVGLSSINISLDTLDPEKFLEITRKNDFNKVITNIKLLLKHNFHVKLNVVVKKGFNDDEITQFLQWTQTENIHIRFIEFMPFDGNNWAMDEVCTYSEILKIIQKNHSIKKLDDAPHATSKAYSVNGSKGTFAVISSVSEHFCGNCNRLRLTTDGKMKNCLFSKGEQDLLTPYRNGEDITAMIGSCMRKKHFKHGGISNIQEIIKDDERLSARSMILIGG